MNDNYTKVEKICNEGYQLEFGTILEDAFNNYKKIAGIGGLAMLLIGVVFVVIFGGMIGIVYGFSDFASTLTGLNPQFMSGSNLLFFLIFSVVIAGIMGPINAGFIRMAYQADQDTTFGLETIFHYYKGNYFKELFIAAVIITFTSNGINYLLTHLGVLYWGNLITYTIAFLTFLTIPLIIFSNLKATEALTMSAKLVLKQPLLLIGLVVLAIVLVCYWNFRILYRYFFYITLFVLNVFYHLCSNRSFCR